MTRPGQGALVAKRIGIVPIGLFAHRDYVRRHCIPRTVAELRQHSGIGFDQDARAYAALRAHGIELDRSLFDFRTDSNPAQLAALRAGMGIDGVQKAPSPRRIRTWFPCYRTSSASPWKCGWRCMRTSARCAVYDCRLIFSPMRLRIGLKLNYEDY